MLPKENRLKTRKDFDQVFKSGKLAFDGFLFLKYCPNQQDHSRVGISIGLKFSKKATERNYAKRVLKEAIRKYINDIVPGYDLVFFIKNTKTDNIKLEIISQLVFKTLQRARLINA